MAAGLAMLLSAAGTGAAQAAQHKVADSLDAAVGKLIDAAFGKAACGNDAHMTLGLWVFDQDKIPIAAPAARRLHEELLARLLAAKPKCVDLIDSAGIGIIIDHLSKTGALAKNGGSLIAALDEAHEKVDLLAFPSLYNQAGKTVLALRVVQRTSGSTLALTPPVAVPSKYLGQDVSDEAISLDAAVKAASKYLSDNAPDLKEVRPLGIFFEDSGAQPPAARYLLDQLVAQLTKNAANVITGKVLKVRSLSIEPVQKPDGSVDAQMLEAEGDQAAYDLFGRYWVRGNAVDVRLSMRRGDGSSVAWPGKIRVADFKDLELRPANPAVTLHDVPQGAFAFQLTSPKGNAPIYRAGEELNLFLRLGQEASVYCFYVDSKGGVLTVLPNHFSANDPNGNRFAAKVLYSLPNAARDPFRFRFTADTSGEELVDCFASSRDVRADLPAALFPDETKVVPFLTLKHLRELFANLKDTKVSEASVTVSVAR
jgi:hypothetical protein